LTQSKPKQQQQIKSESSEADSNAMDVDTEEIQFGKFDFSSKKHTPTYIAQQRKHEPAHVLLKKVTITSTHSSIDHSFNTRITG